jgi:hypothetical protein
MMQKSHVSMMKLIFLSPLLYKGINCQMSPLDLMQYYLQPQGVVFSNVDC